MRTCCWHACLQGVVTLAALLLVLWLPPLVFSQGAPTYTAPSVLSVAVNVSVAQVRDVGGRAVVWRWGAAAYSARRPQSAPWRSNLRHED